MIGINNAIANARLSVISTAINAEGAGAKIQYYGGTQPAAGGAVTDQTLLGEALLPYPMGNAAARSLNLGPIPAATAADAGSITWARFLDGSGNWLFDGDAGEEGSGKLLEITPQSVFQGGGIIITSAVLTE